jgi:Uma2 family endonuclease
MERKGIEGPKDKEEYMSYEDFLDFCDEDTLAEWVNGKIEMYSPASDAHQDLSDWLTSVLRIYAEVKKLGIVRSAPFQMKTGADLPGREPDIIFLRTENRGMLKETYLDGPADLAIEIVSEESLLRDRGEKFAEYEIGGVKEYWILDPDLKRADFFVLKEERYERCVEDERGVYHSEVIQGFWIKVAWLWNLPPVLGVLKELGLIK